jgi:hypothetical protein
MEEYGNDAVSHLRKLSPKHLRFLECVAAGFSQADAYRRAFRPKRLLTPKEAATRASRIALNPLIQQRLHELQGKSDRETLLSFNRRLAILAGIAQSFLSKPVDRIRAIEVYSKLAGDQPAEREELTVRNAGGEAFTVAARGPTKAEKIAAMTAQLNARNARAAGVTHP